MKANPQESGRFEVESLEPRLLLSGDGLMGAALAEELAESDDATSAIYVTEDTGFQVADSTDSEQSGGGLFDVEDSTLVGDSSVADVENGDAESADSSVQDAADLGAETAATGDLSGQFGEQDSTADTAELTSLATTSFEGDANILSQEITNSLNNANGPPMGAEAHDYWVSDSISISGSDTDSGSGFVVSGADGSNELHIGSSETVSGTGSIDGNVVNAGVLAPGNSPGIIVINGDLTIDGLDSDIIGDTDPTGGSGGTVGTIEIEIEGTGTAGTDFDQIQVNGNLTLGGLLDVSVSDSYVPTEGDEFVILTYTGSLSGSFDDATGIFGWGDGSFFMEVDDSVAGQIKLVVKSAGAGGTILSGVQAMNDRVGLFLSEYFDLSGSLASITADFTIDQFIDVQGQFDFLLADLDDLTIGSGVPPELVSAVDALLPPELDFSSPNLTGIDMKALIISGTDVNAFVGLNGPYWEGDLDSDGAISWATPSGVSVTNGDGTPKATVTEGGEDYGDLNGDGIVDANETAELSEDAIGLAVKDLDFAFIILVLDRYQAPLDISAGEAILLAAHRNITLKSFKATANDFRFVGWDEIEVSAQNIEIALNNGSPWPNVVGVGPATLNYAASFETGSGLANGSYDVVTGGDTISFDFAGGHQEFGAENITVRLSEFVHLTGGFHFEKGPSQIVDVATGLSTDALELADTLLETITGLPGGTDFFLNSGGLIEDVRMATMTIGANDVHAFIGIDGPYWEGDTDGDGVVDNEAPGEDLDLDGTLGEDEVNEEALGLVVSNLDFGMVTMTPSLGSFAQAIGLISENTAKNIIPKFTAIRATADTFEFVGWDEVEISADQIEINYNNGTPWFETLGPPVVDFQASYAGNGGGLSVETGGDPVLINFDGNQRIGFSSTDVEVRISEFFHLKGGFSFEKGPVTNVNIATGVPSDALDALELAGNAVLSGLGTAIKDAGALLSDIEVSTMQIGASDVHAFVGLNGPYWSNDLDGDGNISWALPDGTTRTNGDDTPMADITVDGVTYGDLNDDGIVDANETAELNESALGLVVQDLDFGMVTMAPTIGDFATLLGFTEEQLEGIIPKFTAAKASADTFRFVGWDELEITANNININYNDGTEWFDALGPPVVDFANTPGFADEQLELFDFDDSGDVTVGDLRTLTGTGPASAGTGAFSGLYAASDSDDKEIFMDDIIAALDADDGGENDDNQLQVSEAESILDALYVADAATADADGDGKLDPLGFEVGTGGEPVYMDFDGNQRIGFSSEHITVRLSEFVHLTGSFAFEKGPVVNADIATGLPDQLLDLVETTGNAIESGLGTTLRSYGSLIEDVEVATFQIGASNVHAFVGIDGPYWEGDADRDGVVDNEGPGQDLDGDGQLGEDEVNEDALGLVINGLDIGFVTMEPTIGSFASLFGISEETASKFIPKFTAVKATADQVALVGVDDLVLSAEGITINYNNGTEWFGTLGPPVVDFTKSFETSTDAGDGVFQVGTGNPGEFVDIDFDGNQRIGASVEKATLQISEFVHITGNLAFEMGPVQQVALAPGFLSGFTGDIADFLSEEGLEADLDSSIPVNATTSELDFMTVGASDVHAFIGMDGPYWVDSATGPFANGEIDRNLDGSIISAEINDDAAGIIVDDFDFGMAIMKPTSLTNPAKYFALKATARQIGLVGINNVTMEATDILVEINQSSPSVYGLSLFPVVDFANTSQWAVDEELALFDQNSNSILTLGDLATLNAALDVADQFAALDGVATNDITRVDHEMLLDILNTDDTGDSRGIIDYDEAAALLGGDSAALDAVKLADADNDGKIDPPGYEVGTGGAPVYLTMDSSLIRAQGFVELDILDTMFLTGSVAFELGPTETVTLTDGSTKPVTTMSIGAANVTAFIGVDGPYWTDLDGDKEVSWALGDGTPQTQQQAGSADSVVDVDETAELDGNAKGLHITDLDIGILLMAATGLDDLGVYLAAKLNVHDFGLVGIDGLTVSGAFDVELNVGIGLTGLDLSLDPVDFTTSFSEVPDLFDLMDSSGDGVIDTTEQDIAFDLGNIGENITTAAQLASILNSSVGSPPDEFLNMSEVLDKLDDGFETTNQDDIDALDADGNGRLNTGFEVNTGDSSSPVILDFERFLISIQLGGEIELENIFRMYGVFLFEVDSSGLKAFVAAGLEIGPDIDSDNSSKLFTMNALGALIINSDGLAADIDISASVGGALSSIISLNVSARIVFNFTGSDQDITIDAKYVNFLLGTGDLPDSDTYDTSQLSGLTGPLDDRFTVHGDGSATFTISGGAPRLDGSTEADGEYFLISMSGDLTLVQTFVIDAAFHLKISAQGLELGFNGTIDLGGFATLDVDGGAVIEDGVFAAYISLSANINLAGFVISGGAILEINSGNSSRTVYDAVGTGHTVARDTFKVTITATLDLFGVFTGSATVTAGVENGAFSITLDGSFSFFSIVTVDISGYFNGDGTFSITGTLNLDLTVGSGAGEFGILGGLSVTLTESSFTGSGSVSLVVFGEDINIASASVTVNWGNGSWSVYAEGPLSVWLEVTGSSDGTFSIDGGLGLFDAVFEALGEAVEAIGEAVVAAAEAVADALVDLGEAILDFGSDVIDFVDGLLTDIGDLAASVIGEIGSWFSDEKTEVNAVAVQPQYTYTASESGGTLTITNNTSSQLALAIVDGNLVVDAPDFSKSVIVAETRDYERDYTWDGWPPTGEWGPWRQVGATRYEYRTVTFSNMQNFTAAGITQIIIHGSNDSETIILDRDSISIDTDVYGNDGDDIIVTGKGNDYVEGGNGDDTIFTYEGNDELYGQAHDDKLMGGSGNDDSYGGSGNDLLDESDERENSITEIVETNRMYGGSGIDQILGSPGTDIIEGGTGDDVLVGFANDDRYVFDNAYGTDTFVDYNGQEILDFSIATDNLDADMTDTGFTANAGVGHDLVVDIFVWIDEVRLGEGDDDFAITALPTHRLDITDADGTDLYDFDLDQADVAQSVARVDIVDNAGVNDLIDLNFDSTGYDIYLHPLAVLLNNLELTFNTGVDKLHITDNAAQTVVTTKPGSGFDELLLKSGVTITSATDGPIELRGPLDFSLESGALIQTAGDVVIRGDYADVDSNGATIELLGTINADTVTVHGGDDDDTVTVGNVTSGTETTIWTYGGSDTVNVRTIDEVTTVNAGDNGDTINVGSAAPAGNGNVDGISAALNLFGDGGADTLNVDDTGDSNNNVGTLTSTRISGLDMSGYIDYDSFSTLNVDLGTGDDTFTVETTHGGSTNLDTKDGADVINIKTILGTTNLDSGIGSDVINVGSQAAGTLGNKQNNTGGNLNSIGAALVIEGNDPTSGSDVLVVDDTADILGNTGTLTSTTITGLGLAPAGITYTGIEHLIISLGSGADDFTINSTHGSATSPYQEETILNTGAGTDSVHINDATDLLFVNGEADPDTINVFGTDPDSVTTLHGNGAADTINVYSNMDGTLNVFGDGGNDTVNVLGTGLGSVATLDGDNDSDTFNIRAMDGTVTVLGDGGNDTVNVGSLTPALPGAPTTEIGNVDAINGLLTVDGGTGTNDVLNVDDSNPTTKTKSGTLTNATIRGLELEQGIDYSNFFALNIWLASGNNIFDINSTHAGETTVSTAEGEDTVNINDASGQLTINAEENDDTVNVRATSPGSTTYVNGQGGNDTVNISDTSPTLPAAYPATLPPSAADTVGSIDSIDGLVSFDGGADTDDLNIDDSASTANKVGTLTGTTLRGLDLPAGVDYFNLEDVNLWLGNGADELFIESTHTGTTQVYTGDGNATVNQFDDTVAIKSIGGITTIHTQAGNDRILVNVQSVNADGSSPYERTHANGLSAVLNLHGDGDSDDYTINLASEGTALINVEDFGAPDDGVDTLTINGADDPAGSNNDDTILIRKNFVAALNKSSGSETFDQVERVNYNENINARLVVNGLRGNDKIVADDNSTTTTIDGGEDDDEIQIGQVFGTPRTTDAGLPVDDTFDTSPIVVGVVTDLIGNVIFDPSTFDPVTDTMDPLVQAAIEQLIADNPGASIPGIAYVSDGVSHATTVYGGNGEDTINVYHNKGTLRLEGEAGDDEFIVRAFVTISLTQQAETEVNGGSGVDTINYAINAPVSIDGGAGFDKVVVLGTPFNDSFVVSAEGIFGAGLNIKFDNVESAELDTLEGDDTIFVLSTRADIVTTVIGGLGNDDIRILGDVTNVIISDDLLGASGLITHNMSSNGIYDGANAGGVAPNIVTDEAGSLINISGISTFLKVSEQGLVASYFISLVEPASLTNTVYLTVSAGLASTTDRSTGSESILVSLTDDPSAFTDAVVIVWEPGVNASEEFEIFVSAIDDSAPEGARVALVSHGIISDDVAYSQSVLIDAFVDIVDDELPGLDIVLGSSGAGFDDSHITEVLENGFTDTYTVTLTAEPLSGEFVTVSLSDLSGQVSAKFDSTGTNAFVFNSGNWDVPQTVTVSAVTGDGDDGTKKTDVTHTITSTGGTYSGSIEEQTVEVVVHDEETPTVIVQESAGSTIIVGNGTDIYRIRLSQSPVAGEIATITLATDGQTDIVTNARISSAGLNLYELSFNDGNWDTWVNVEVVKGSAVKDASDKSKEFVPGAQDLSQIEGPLIVEGSVGPNSGNRALNSALTLPGETDPGVQTGSQTVDESDSIDMLSIYHADNPDDDFGFLSYRIGSYENVGLALTGFEMGGDLPFDESGLIFGGGITYNGFETVELLLGNGDENLTINDTGDWDEKAFAAGEIDDDGATITMIHGAGGSDTITINDRGNGPLVVYGDTSEDGSRYDNDTGAAGFDAAPFIEPAGADTIDASNMLEKSGAFSGVVIYGGPEGDTLTGSQDNDHIAGGEGADTIHAQGGNDHVYGDSHFNVDLNLFAQDEVDPFDSSDPVELAMINAMFTIPVTGSGFSDTINANGGNDVVFGDHGVIDQIAGTRRITTTGSMVSIHTVSLSEGDADTIHGNAGNDILIGGRGNDLMFGDDGSDLILGDFGSVVENGFGPVDLTLIGAVDGAGVQNPFANFIYTSDTSGLADDFSGSDILHGGSLTVLDLDTGSNIILGQQGADTIYGGGSDDDIYGGHNVANGLDTGDFIDGLAGNDVILADNGLIERASTATDPRFGVLQGTLIYNIWAADQVVDGLTGTNPDSGPTRRIELFDHDDSANNVGNFGHDTIAGGADDDLIFGQLGNDSIHGDGKLVDASGSLILGSLTATISGSDVGGDDYVEGNGGTDVIFGGLGQDDLIGGSSDLYNLDLRTDRPDGSDTIYGGNGNMAGRNDDGSASVDEQGNSNLTSGELHSRDSDMILGDNGNIYRLVGTDGIAGPSLLTFNYDNYDADRKIVVRAARLLDYTPGGADIDAASAALDIGAADEIHGESGDDFIYGMLGHDLLYGDAQNDDLIGGVGNDWISGGTGDDGILGDDGRLWTSRNGTAEPLYGIAAIPEGGLDLTIATPGDWQIATINITGVLKKTAILEPYMLTQVATIAGTTPSNDILFGGLGNDAIHGGAGDDAMSGAEALPQYFSNPMNPGNILGWGLVRPGEFAAYDEYNPLAKVFVDPLNNYEFTDSTTLGAIEFILNFDASELDGNDLLFGDVGNDWIVGGHGNDNLYGGYGDDLLNADDNHDTNAGLNDIADGPDASHEDRAFGGAGRDILIANTGGDRLIDWTGEFNSYLVPFGPFGAPTISRALPPQLMDFLYDLSASDGADPTRSEKTGSDAARNGEPEGELGLVKQSDLDWRAQTGAPDDPQPGNIPGGARDVRKSANFNDGTSDSFAADSGSWIVQGGRLEVAPEVLGGDAVSVFMIEDMLPRYFELQATINAVKPIAGYKANAYLIFDYQSETDFKFAGINDSTNKLEIGHRDAAGWHVDIQRHMTVQAGKDYNMLLSINGVTATLVVNNSSSHIVSYTFDPRVVDGYSYDLNNGMVGIGADNGRAQLDNVSVLVLPPESTIELFDDFSDGSAEILTADQVGEWNIVNALLHGDAPVGGTFAVSNFNLELGLNSILQVDIVGQADSAAAAIGIVFDYYDEDNFKYVAVNVGSDQIVIGHRAKGKWAVDASVDRVIPVDEQVALSLSLKGNTASLSLNGQSVIGHVFNSVVVDGQAGLFSMDGSGTFDEYTVMTNASQFAVAVSTHQEASSTEVIQPVEYLASDASELSEIMNASSQFWGNSGLVAVENDSTLSTVSEPEEIGQVVLDAYDASYALNSDADSYLFDAYLLGFDSWIQFSSGGTEVDTRSDASGTGYSYDPLYVSEFNYFTAESSLLTLVNSSLLETTRYILPDYSSDESGYSIFRG